MNKKTDLEALSVIMTREGWQECCVTESARKAGLDAVFECGYAQTGIILAGDSRGVLSSWAESQVELVKLRQKGDSLHRRDAYLLFIVDAIEDSARDELRDIVNDTHDCQKVCIELNDRDLEEVLREAHFLNLPSLTEVPDSGLPDAASALEKVGLPGKLVRDLAKSGAATVLDRLIKGAYEMGDTSDAD